jgi:hypothetical protein
MVWQDLVIAIANVLFGYSLFYQVFRGFKEKRGFLALQTSFLTSIGLYAVAFVYLSLKLYISTVIAFLSAIFWTLLFIQGLVYEKA